MSAFLRSQPHVLRQLKASVGLALVFETNSATSCVSMPPTLRCRLRGQNDWLVNGDTCEESGWDLVTSIAVFRTVRCDRLVLVMMWVRKEKTRTISFGQLKVQSAKENRKNSKKKTNKQIVKKQSLKGWLKAQQIAKQKVKTEWKYFQFKIVTKVHIYER